jgi:hypothetical protein
MLNYFSEAVISEGRKKEAVGEGNKEKKNNAKEEKEERKVKDYDPKNIQYLFVR